MGWERRRRGGQYYTRSRKIGGRVIREYIGTGPLAEIASKLDAIEREERTVEAERRRRHQERLESADAAVDALCHSAEVLARVALLAAGYHRHDRGEWRKRRV